MAMRLMRLCTILVLVSGIAPMQLVVAWVHLCVFDSRLANFGLTDVVANPHG